MNELIAAAKDVIEASDTGDRWCAIANLKSAVDRAETAIKDTEAYEHGYIAGQKAMKAHERERIRARVMELGKDWIIDTTVQQYADALLEDSDATTE